MFVSHFSDPDLRVEIFFEKEGAAENRGVDFEIWTQAPLHTSMEVEEIFIQSLSVLLFYCFFGDRKQLLKAVLTCTKAAPV